MQALLKAHPHQRIRCIQAPLFCILPPPAFPAYLFVPFFGQAQAARADVAHSRAAQHAHNLGGAPAVVRDGEDVRHAVGQVLKVCGHAVEGRAAAEHHDARCGRKPAVLRQQAALAPLLGWSGQGVHGSCPRQPSPTCQMGKGRSRASVTTVQRHYSSALLRRSQCAGHRERQPASAKPLPGRTSPLPSTVETPAARRQKRHWLAVHASRYGLSVTWNGRLGGDHVPRSSSFRPGSDHMAGLHPTVTIQTPRSPGLKSIQLFVKSTARIAQMADVRPVP